MLRIPWNTLKVLQRQRERERERKKERDRERALLTLRPAAKDAESPGTRGGPAAVPSRGVGLEVSDLDQVLGSGPHRGYVVVPSASWFSRSAYSFQASTKASA